MPSRDDYFFSVAHALDLLSLGDSLGCSSERVLEGLALSAHALALPEARISLADLTDVIVRLESLSGSRTLGIELGLRMQAPVHGYLGFAIMASATLLEGLQLVARFTPTRTNALRAELVVDAQEAVLYIEELTDLGRAREAVLTAVAVSVWKIAQSMTHAQFEARCELPFASATGVRSTRVRQLSLHYEQPRCCVRFAAPLLNLAIHTAQPTGYQLAREQCERELQSLARSTLEVRVRAALSRAQASAQTAEEIARTLGVSSSTLKRKLKSEGTSFSALLEAEQSQRACQLLCGDRLSIEQVAEQVGYTDVSNFGRAFRRWTGTTPAAYRKAHTS